jgi:hypothetical protein
LELHAFNSGGGTGGTIENPRLVFDNADTTRPDSSSFSGVQTTWTPTVIPEPSSFALLGLGAAGVLARRRRQAA